MPPSPARPSARERLLDAATELFFAHGIAATGVDAILRRAQVAPATLYAHFAGKDALVAAYLQRRHERWRAAWDEALVCAGNDARARVLALFDALAAFPGPTAQDQPRRGCAFLAAAVEVTDDEHPAWRWLDADTRLLAGRVRVLCTEAGAADPGALSAELLLIYDGALAARTRQGVITHAGANGDVTDVGWPDIALCRALARDAVSRHLP